MKKILFFLILLAAMLPTALKAQDLIDFETQDFSQMEALGTVTNSTTYPWTVETPTSTFAGYSGSFCMKSGNAGVGSSESSIEFTVTYLFNGSISFLGGCWGEGTSSIWDKCQFYIDGVQQFEHGALAAWDTYSFPVTAGPHTFKWSYNKDSSVNPTGDAFLVDDIIIEGITVISCPRPETITVSDITAHEASLVWTDESASGNYVVQCKKESQSWDDEDIFTENTSNTELELTDLEGNTTYNVRVASVCGSENSLWRFTNFRTECAAITSIPVIWDFENYNTAGSTSYPLPSCWSRTGTNYPYSYNYSYYAHSGTYILASNYNPTNNIAILPAINFEELPLNTLQLRFFARVYTLNGNGSLEVGLLPDPSDASTFVTVGTVSTDNGLTDEYAEFEVSFADYEGDLENPFIALRMNGEASNSYSSQYIYMDDIVLEHVPACALPTGIAVSNVTSTSADITVNDPAETGSYRLYIQSGEELDSMDVSATTSLSDLTPGSFYTVSAATLCDDGSVTRTVSFTFSTLCETLDSDAIPYIEDFDSYTNVASDLSTPSNYPDVELPSCWIFLNRSLTENVFPQAFLTSSTSYASSGNCLFFKSSMNTPLYAVLPQFEENIRNLILSFTYRNEGTYESNGILSVGYMTNPFDASTFVEFLTCPRTTDKTRMEQLFSIVPEDVENAFIAFRYSGGSSENYYLSIDSVVVDLIPDCIHPAAVSVNNITNNSAEIVIADPTEANNYHVIVKKDTITISEEDITSVNYPLNNLETNTTYSVSVATNCEDGIVTPAISTMFTTQCDLLTTLPQVWDFENLDIDETNDYPLPACWSRTDDNIPYLYTGGSYYNYAHSGFTCLYSYDNNKILVLPPVDNTLIPINSMQMSFYARCYGYYSSDVEGTIEVGVMTDPLVDSTFVPLTSIELTSTYEPYDILLNTAPEDATYIALRLSTLNNTIHLDDVTLESIPSCVRPSAIIANNITTNSADISIVDPNEAMNYHLFVDNGTTIDTIELQDTTYTLTELSSATSYTVSVATVCENDSLTNTTSTSFQTSCDLITADMLPKTWDFESNNYGGTTSYPLPTCWSRSANTFPYVETDDYDYGYSLSGTNFLYVYCYNPSTYYLFLPEIDVDNIPLNTLQLRLSAKVAYDDNTATIQVGVLSEPSNVSTFTPVSSISTSTGITTDYDEFELSLAGFEGEGTESHIAIRIDISGYYDEDWEEYDYAELNIDDVVLEFLSSCARPTNFTLAENTQTTVSLTWDDSETPENWNVVYGPAGFNPDTTEGVLVAVADENSITIEDLTTGTMYDFYVQANCGGGEVSGWRGPVTATPGSYNMLKTGSDTITTCNMVIYDDGGFDRNYSTGCNSYLVINPETEGAFIYVSGTYYIETGSSSRYDYLQIFDGTEATGTPLFDSHLEGNQGTISVTSASGPLTLYFHSDGSICYDGFELNVSCVTCASPAFTAVASSETEIDVTITSGNDSWDLLYGEHGFDPETAGELVDNLTTATYTISNLSSGTVYDIYARSNCADGESVWAGPVYVVLGSHNMPASGTDTITSCGAVIYDDGGINGNYSNGCNGYLVVYPEADTLLVQVSGTLIAEICSYDYLVIYDGVGSSGTELYRSSQASGSQVTVSATSVSGPLTIFFHSDNSTNYDGFELFVTCVEGTGPQPEICNAPTNVTATEVTKNSAIINWEQEGTPDSWTISYKKNSADTWTTVEGLTSHPYTLTNLDPETVYNVNVKAVCGTVVSETSATINFETLPDGVDVYANSTLLYPNPTTGQFRIENSELRIENVEVYDVYGKLLNSVEVNDHSTVIDVTGYASGIYFTRIYTDKGMVVKQIVKK